MNLVFVTLSVLVCFSPLSAAGKKETSCTNEFSFRSTESADAFLASVLNPISVDDFFENHFQQKAASAQRPKMPSYYGPMASFDDVQYALEFGYGSNPNKRLVYGKDWKLAKRVFRDGDYWTGLYKGDSVDLGVEEAMAAVGSGFTVIMNGVQSAMPNVYQGAWQLETALGWHVNVNLYISPPGGAQGFEAHLDWMDGFIFQITGKKRWKVYEPALVSFPRPDLVHKPPLSFLEEGGDSVESDLMMKAGDFAYIPRGVVHQAHTSREDVKTAESTSDPAKPEESPIYQQASMHLTFGLELAKDSSVEMLLHHFISKQSPAVFDTLAESLQALSPSNETKPFFFESDNGKVSFQCTSSSGFADSGDSTSGVIQSPPASVELETVTSPRPLPSTCTERDILHLLLSAMAGYISMNETAFINQDQQSDEEEESYMDSDTDFSTNLLRKAVGVTARTSAMSTLDPRVLLPQGLDVFSQAIQQLGMPQLLRFLVEKQMLTATIKIGAEENSETCTNTDGANVSSELITETLYPSAGSAQSFTTLGSDFSCKYIEPFFSKSFKTKELAGLDLQLDVSDISSRESLVKKSERQQVDAQIDQKKSMSKQIQERSYDRRAMASFLSQDSWSRVDKVLSDFVGHTLRRQLQKTTTNEGHEDTAPGSSSTSRRHKKRRRGGDVSYIESDVYCDAWKSMMNSMATDKKLRKKAGHSSLENAGYQMNAS